MIIPPGYSLFVQDMQHSSRLLAPCLDALRGQRLFLTGCTAFIGKWLIDTLLWLNETHSLDLHLYILVRRPKHFLQDMPHLFGHNGATLLYGDITNFDTSSLHDFTYAIHAANFANDGSPQWAARHMQVATLGTERLYQLAAERCCRAILFTSSGAVYGTKAIGNCDNGQLYEEAQPVVLNEPRVYGETKRFLELYAVALGQTYNISTVLARCFAFSGAHVGFNGNALSSFMADALAGRDIHIKGDGTPVRSYLYGADMVVWLIMLLILGENAVPYNVGSERGVSLAELALKVQHCVNNSVRVCIEGVPLQGNAPLQYVPSTIRLRERLGVNELVSLEEGLRFMLAWHTKKS